MEASISNSDNIKVSLSTSINLNSGLIAQYKLNGNSHDTLGVYNGTDTSITYPSGKINQSAAFDGMTSQISLGNVNAGNLSNGFTFCGWLKTYKPVVVGSNFMCNTGTGATTGIASGNYWKGRQGIDTNGGKLFSYVVPNTNYGSAVLALYGYQTNTAVIAGTYLIKDTVTNAVLGSGNLVQRASNASDKRLNGVYAFNLSGNPVLVEVYFSNNTDMYLNYLNIIPCGYDGVLTKLNALTILVTGGAYRCYINNTSMLSGSSTDFIPNNVWQHCIMTYDNNNFNIYRNNILIKSVAYTVPITTNTNPFILGEMLVAPSGMRWWGEMDDIRLYNRVLNSLERQEIYNFARGREQSTSEGFPITATISNSDSLSVSIARQD